MLARDMTFYFSSTVPLQGVVRYNGDLPSPEKSHETASIPE
jgi:hypothetical protein